MKEKRKSVIYWDAFTNEVLEASDIKNADTDTVKKIIFYGIKGMINRDKPKSYSQAVDDFYTLSYIKQAVSRLTPVQFMTVFPIDKEFDGEKWGTKDYFYTMDYINSFGKDKLIGDSVSEFLFEYTNINIMLFNVMVMSCMSDINRFQGKQTLAEQWVSEMGLKTYTRHTDSQGREYIMDSEGHTHKISKPRPRYLRLVK